jgi:hypothetical protein
MFLAADVGIFGGCEGAGVACYAFLRWWERLGFEDLRAGDVEGMGKLLVT